MAASATQPSGLERSLALGKDMFALLRDGSLFVFAALLLMFPAQLNSVLTSAGFEEGSIVGFKWKAQLVASDDALATAKASIDNLQRQLKQANDALAEAKTAVPSGALREKIQEVEQAGREVTAASVGASAAVQSTIVANAPLVERAQASIATPGGWAVVFGSDKTLASASDEIQRASKAGITNTGVYFRNGYYASLSVVPTRERAADFLQIAKSFRNDAYVARFSTWCLSAVQREGYIECAPTR